MDEELATANQRIDDMSFKDLTARAAVAQKPAETATTPDNQKGPKAADTAAPAKSKTS